LATDGNWGFTLSQTVVDIGGTHLMHWEKYATLACYEFIKFAAKTWHDKEGEYQDDMTAFIARFQHTSIRSHGRHTKQQQRKTSPTNASDQSDKVK
jgi:hypothetical protein